MKKKIDNYSFNKAAKTITFTDYSTIRLDAMLLITNATDGIIIFNFADPTKGGTVLTNVLTLAYDTSSMDNADKLLIYYDDSALSQDTSNLATSVNQATLESLINTLQELIQRLAPLASAVTMVGGQSLKVSGSVAVSSAPSTAVTGPITSANSIAEKNIAGVSYTQKVAGENLTAILGNINNAIMK